MSGARGTESGTFVTHWGGYIFSDESRLYHNDCFIQILRDHIQRCATGVFGGKFVFVQDSTTATCSMLHGTILGQHDVEVIGRPAMSPDMNPIEHVWDQMSIWNRDMVRPNLAKLQQAVRQVWRAVRTRNVITLVESMPRRVEAALAARGEHTRCYKTWTISLNFSHSCGRFGKISFKWRKHERMWHIRLVL